MRTALALGLLLLAAIPGASAQADPYQLFILHDAAPDGYADVRSPLQFGYLLLKDGEPTRHRNGQIGAYYDPSRDGSHLTPLYETTYDAGHDYDALNLLTFSFAFAHPYAIQAKVPVGPAIEKQATFRVEARAPPPNTQIHLDVTKTFQGPQGRFTIRLLDPNQTLVPHSDALVEIRRADHWLVLRTHLHTHEDAMTFNYTFPKTGAYTMSVVGYNAYPRPGPDQPHYAPVAVQIPIQIDEPYTPPLPNPLRPYRDEPGGIPVGHLKLLTSIDPQDSITPFSRFVMSGIIYNTTSRDLEPHTDFHARVTDDNGNPLFDSNSLHEYDGVYDLTWHWPHPGQYQAQFSTYHGRQSIDVTRDLTIAQVLPGDGQIFPGGGPLVVTSDFPPEGEPGDVTFHASWGLVAPAAHTEIDLEFVNGDGVPFLQNKIHTHDSGDFNVKIERPCWKDAKAFIDPVSIHGEAATSYAYQTLTGSLVANFLESPGCPSPEMRAVPILAPSHLAQMPSVSIGVACLALLAALCVARRHAGRRF